MWYEELNKPFLTPPAFVFPIAWTILYILMAVSVFFFVREAKERIYPLVIFSIQLLLNLLWAPTFFMSHNIQMALLIVLLMIAFTAYTISLFYKQSKISAYLLIPYLLWIIFAAYLNFEFLRLN